MLYLFSQYSVSLLSLIEKQSVVEIFYIIKHVFHFKKNRSTAPMDYKWHRSWTSFHGNNCALMHIVIMVWKLKLRYMILLFEDLKTDEGTGLYPCQSKQMWRIKSSGPNWQRSQSPGIEMWIHNWLKCNCTWCSRMVTHWHDEFDSKLT